MGGVLASTSSAARFLQFLSSNFTGRSLDDELDVDGMRVLSIFGRRRKTRSSGIAGIVGAISGKLASPALIIR